MPTRLGVNFWGEFGERGRKFSEIYLFGEEFAEKFVGNSPKVRLSQVQNSTQIRSAEPLDR